MFFSSSGKKRLALAVLGAALGIAAAHAQARVPLEMIESRIAKKFDYVPKTEFHRVFQNFNKTMYSGRNYVLDREIEDFGYSFVLYLESTKIDAEWAKYKPKPPPPPPPPPPRPPSPPPFHATHRLSADLTLFAAEGAGSAAVASLKKGAGVIVESLGGYDDIDGIAAKWAKVRTETGQSGWLFSGYLETAK